MSTLKKLRAKAGLTQEEMAERMSVSTRTIRAWEKKLPGQDTVETLASVLDCTVPDLFQDSDSVMAPEVVDSREVSSMLSFPKLE